MNLHIEKASAIGIGVTLFSPAARGTELEQAQTIVGMAPIIAAVLFAIVAAFLILSTKFRDKRSTPLDRIFEASKAIHSVGPDTSVWECVRKMTDRKIGALLVMDSDRMVGIFTERDALNKVLAAGLDPGRTKVSEVMTNDPFTLPPQTTVGAAMELVTQRRFRHLPIVEDGKVLAVVSSGDLTRWLVKDQIGEVRELVDLAAR